VDVATILQKYLQNSPFFQCYDVLLTSACDHALYRICEAVFQHHAVEYAHPTTRNESSTIPFIDPLHGCTAFWVFYVWHARCIQL